MSTSVVVKKKLMMFESFVEGEADRRCSSKRKGGRIRRMKGLSLPAASAFNTNKTSSFSSLEGDGEMMGTRRSGNKRTSLLNADLISSTKSRKTGYFSCCNKVSSSGTSTTKAVLLYNFPICFIVLVTMMNFAKVAESVPAATVENLDSKIKMFLESRCTMQNETLEQEEFKSFMSCGPSHGAGIVKNLGQIPEYKSDDMEQWAKATKREIISQCEVWPQDRSCQETTYRLIEKCFEKDQKFIFYFMFALTDVICQTEQSDLFVKFWQNGGDACLGNHIKSLKKDWSECSEKTSTVSNDDVYRNFDSVMQCFRSQFDNDCFGEGADEVLGEILAEIRKVYLETASFASSTLSSTFIVFLTTITGWTTLFWQQRLLLQ